MSAIRSLQRAVAALVGAPVVLAGGVASALLVAPQSTLNFVAQFAGEPLGGVSGLGSYLLSFLTFFVTPLVVAGTVGMAREALDEGTTGLDTFLTVARDRYVSLLIAFVLRTGLLLLLGVLVGIVTLVGVVVLTFVVGFGAGVTGAVGPGGGAEGLLGAVGVGALVVLALVALVSVLVVVVPVFFIQFLAVAVVTEETGVVEGFRRSIGVVRRNLVSTLGFSLIRVVVSLAASLPVIAIVGLRLWETIQSPAFGPGAVQGGVAILSLPETLALTGVSLSIQVFVMPFMITYATAFYGEYRPE